MGNIVSDINKTFSKQSNIAFFYSKGNDDIITAESIDNYLGKCGDHKNNHKARMNLVYSYNQISPVEKKYNTTFLQTIINRLPVRLSTDLNKIIITQLFPSAEGGMPHTRPLIGEYDGMICFPNMSQFYSVNTLIHELWHIHQRKYKDLWTKLFNKQRWKQWNEELPKDLEENRRFNPDTLDCPLWIFQDSWIPIPIFRDISNPKIGDVDIWFFNPEKRIRTRNIPGEFISYYSDSLPNVAFEHPRELAAYILSDHKKYDNTIAFKDLVEEMGIISLPENNYEGN